MGKRGKFSVFWLSMTVLVSMVNKETTIYGFKLLWLIFMLIVIVFV
jgi:hypothetical protein